MCPTHCKMISFSIVTMFCNLTYDCFCKFHEVISVRESGSEKEDIPDCVEIATTMTFLCVLNDVLEITIAGLFL